MHNFELVDTGATSAFLRILRTIKTKGTPLLVRDLQTMEVINNSEVFDMSYPFILHPNRKLNFKFLGAEIEAICSGDNRVENLAKYNERMRQFSDDGLILNGAYGPPFNHQLMYAVHNLVRDRASRQAVISIWKPNPIDSKDIRCTLSLQFLIRNGRMHTVVNMRSSDAIWGVCYDFPVFVFMTLRVLTMYNGYMRRDEVIELGNCYWNAASSHYYEHHYDLVDEILNSGSEGYDTLVGLSGTCTEDWKDCIHYYNLLKRGEFPIVSAMGVDK